MFQKLLAAIIMFGRASLISLKPPHAILPPGHVGGGLHRHGLRPSTGRVGGPHTEQKSVAPPKYRKPSTQSGVRPAELTRINNIHRINSLELLILLDYSSRLFIALDWSR